MATQIGIDPGTGEPIYAALTPAQLAAIGFDASGQAIPNFQYNQQVWQQANPGVTNTSLNKVLSETPLSQSAIQFIKQQAYTQPITEDLIQQAQRAYPAAPEPKAYKPGSTMYELGFNNESEYKGAAARKGKGPHYEERLKEKAARG